MLGNKFRNDVTYDVYEKLKLKSIKKSYASRFRVAKYILSFFSYFANVVSVFLAYFFFESIFKNSFSDVGDSILIVYGIIIFLSLFELLKRYVFSVFSLELIRTKFQIFRSSMISFILAVVVLLFGSVYFSLNGAKKFVDKQAVIEAQASEDVTVAVDSINTFYLEEYIRPLKEENDKLQAEKDKYANHRRLAESTKALIASNNEQMKTNKELITKYETERDVKIQQIREDAIFLMESGKEENKSNILSFVLISALIEILIIIGVYFNRHYDYRVILEYEREIANTVGFKRWSKFDGLLCLIMEEANVEDKVPSVQSVKEMLALNGVEMSTRELDDFFKLATHLKMIERRGNRRVISMEFEQARPMLKKHFRIH